MKKTIDPVLSKDQLIIGVSDYHDKNNPANVSHKTCLESLIARCKNKKSKLIVEDLSSINSDGKGVCCNYTINGRAGLLGKLADTARLHAVDVDNVEYRFCRVVALGPLLNNTCPTPKNCASIASITVHSLYKEVVEELKKISAYNDSSQLNAVYKDIVACVTRQLKQLKLESAVDQSIADYCSCFTKNTYGKNLEKLCIFDSSLLDAKIVHSIASAQDKAIILVIAGGSHIEKMNTLLEKIGYKKINSSESSLSSGNEDKNGKFRPQAIALDILDQFFSKHF